MSYEWKFILLFVIHFCLSVEQNGPTVEINQGKLMGKLIKNGNGLQYTSFFNIPYAKPPVGDLRFKNPIAADGWNGTRDASKEGPVCIQYDSLFSSHNGIFGEEDCLILNVHVPGGTRQNLSLPVMVWIHGGGFAVGSGDSMFYGPELLVQKDVILVTINYRLGALGFLSLGVPEAPGNVGLKDQVLALKWVKDNIQYFGGNNKKVTIFGESAGGASVHFHLVSKMSKGLFRNAIAQSGSCLHYWVIQENPKDFAFELGSMLGHNSQEEHKLLDFLKHIPAEKIAAQIVKNDIFGFKPVVEKEFQNQDVFLSKPPLDLIKSGDFYKCPFISGFNSNEGVFAIYVYKRNGIPPIDFSDPLRFLPVSKMNASELTEALRVMKRLYPGDGDPWENTSKYFAEFDVFRIIKNTNKFITAASATVYSYSFSYHGNRNIISYLSNITDYKGASHFDDIGYLFTSTMLKNDISEKDQLVIEQMTRMWTNFAKYNNPTPMENEVKWLPVEPENYPLLEISDKVEMKTNTFNEAVHFWEEMSKY